MISFHIDDFIAAFQWFIDIVLTQVYLIFINNCFPWIKIVVVLPIVTSFSIFSFPTWIQGNKKNKYMQASHLMSWRMPPKFFVKDELLGERGFHHVYKGWIDEHTYTTWTRNGYCCKKVSSSKGMVDKCLLSSKPIRGVVALLIVTPHPLPPLKVYSFLLSYTPHLLSRPIIIRLIIYISFLFSYHFSHFVPKWILEERNQLEYNISVKKK